jgi:hypothetical protein
MEPISPSHLKQPPEPRPPEQKDRPFQENALVERNAYLLKNPNIGRVNTWENADQSGRCRGLTSRGKGR